jgi:hypothetical protein
MIHNIESFFGHHVRIINIQNTFDTDIDLEKKTQGGK